MTHVALQSELLTILNKFIRWLHQISSLKIFGLLQLQALCDCCGRSSGSGVDKVLGPTADVHLVCTSSCASVINTLLFWPPCQAHGSVLMLPRIYRISLQPRSCKDVPGWVPGTEDLQGPKPKRKNKVTTKCKLLRTSVRPTVHVLMDIII